MAHTFTLPPVDDDVPEPDIDDFTFHDALDVVEFAEYGGICVDKMCCSSWHLDARGGFVCGTNGDRFDSLAQWATDPSRLLRAAAAGVDGAPCGSRWVVIDERLRSLCGDHVVGEGDVEQFLRLRCAMAAVGVDVVDAVIFDDDEHWWSICELLTGSTRWGAMQLPCIDIESGSRSGRRPGQRPGRRPGRRQAC